MMYWLSVHTHKAGVVSSNPTCFTIKISLVRKATGNHLIISTLGKLRALVGWKSLEIEYSKQQILANGVKAVRTFEKNLPVEWHIAREHVRCSFNLQSMWLG